MQRIRYSRYFKIIFILIDIFIVSGVLYLFFIRNNDFRFDDDSWDESLLILITLILYWGLLSGRSKLYSIPRNLTYTLYLERLFFHMLLFILGIYLVSFLNKNSFLIRDRAILVISLFAVLVFVKSLIFFILTSLRSIGINHRNIMFLDKSFSAEILKSRLQEQKGFGFKVFDYPENKPLTVDHLKLFWKKNGIHSLFLDLQSEYITPELESEIFKEAELAKVRINLIPQLVQNNFYEYDLSYIQTQPVLTPAKFPLDQLSNFILKRGFDIIFSLIVFVFVLSWLYPLIAILIKMDSKGPVLFKQKRYGYHDEIFTCYKFRTMVINEDSTSKTTLKNDERITPIGRFLRKSSLDEFPQFINALKGEMSVVGPRPHMILVDEFYKSKIRRFSLRSSVKPGITGLAQVNGHRGDRENMDIEMQKRVMADLFYVRNWSFILDCIIVLKTGYLILFGDKNAH